MGKAAQAAGVLAAVLWAGAAGAQEAPAQSADAPKVILSGLPQPTGLYGGTVQFGRKAFPLLANRQESEVQRLMLYTRPPLCDACGGKGRVTRTRIIGYQNMGRFRKPIVREEEEVCSTCRGLGTVYHNRFMSNLLVLIEALAHVERTGRFDALRDQAAIRIKAAFDPNAQPFFEAIWKGVSDLLPEGQPVILAGTLSDKTEINQMVYARLREPVTDPAPAGPPFRPPRGPVVAPPSRLVIIICGTRRSDTLPEGRVVVGGLLVGSWQKGGAAVAVAAEPPPAPEGACKLLGVVASNILHVEWQGRTEHLRLLKVKSISTGALGYEAAVAALKDLLKGDTLGLAFETPGQRRRDAQGCLLAYVYSGGECVNARLVDQGWGEERHVRPRPVPARDEPSADDKAPVILPIAHAEPP